MKKRLLALLVLPSLTLSACSFFNFETYDTYSKTISVYNIDKLDESKDLANSIPFTINARFIEGQDYVPFITLKQYASLYLTHIAADVSYEIKDDTWTIYKNGSPCFIAAFDHVFKEVLMAGSMQSAYKDGDDPRDLAVLSYGVDYKSTLNYIGDTAYSLFSFSEYNIPSFKYEGERYYPLAFFDTTFIDSSSIYFTYNYKHILSTRDVENYSEVTYIDEGKEYTFDSQMEEVCQEDNKVIPSYLAKLNANLFIYLMDNFYGLRDIRNIKNFKKYYSEQHNIYNLLTSSDNESRGFAYSDALSILDDNHTLLVSANKSWGEDVASRYRRYGEACYRRSTIRTSLNQYRSAAYGEQQAQKDILFSQDGKTALFSFDSFKFGSSEEVFNEDKSIKDTAGEYDTFYLLVDVFNELKNRGNVENIILDISLNGGGVLGVMLKLLALISKDNSSKVTMYEDTNGQTVSYAPRIDVNGDKKYDADDVFGDDFNFYILTSDCSYSCGNAFPCAAQLHGDAKIIGQKSGGGECVVSIHYLPNSQYVYHSSNTHLGIWDEQNKKFNGFENGATPDIELTIDDSFYDIDALNLAIQNAQ